MKIAFTICSNNYLSQAKTLGDSLIENNSDYKFIIGLCDKRAASIDYSVEIPYEFINIEDIGIEDLPELWRNYNIIELNTSIKASLFRQIFKRYDDCDFVLYFDPDIQIFSSLKEVESKFEVNEIILTPHIYRPIPFSIERPNENDFLNYGIYNLGFLGLKRTEQVMNKLLPWWEERLLKACYIKPEEGLFVDQIWFNLVPILFSSVKVIYDPGCNIAPWNIQERSVEWDRDHYKVNKDYDLIFFHFSSFKICDTNKYFSNYGRNISFINDTLKTLYNNYKELLLKNNLEKYSKIECYYVYLREQYQIEKRKKDETLLKKIKRVIKSLMPLFMYNFIVKKNGRSSRLS